MSGDTETAAADESGTPAGAERKTPRETAPMSEFGTGNAAVGILVLAVGLAISFGVPLLVL